MPLTIPRVEVLAELDRAGRRGGGTASEDAVVAVVLGGDDDPHAADTDEDGGDDGQRADRGRAGPAGADSR